MTTLLTRKTTFLKSPLNYIGGKYKVLSQILPLFPRQNDIFMDLFCGGCNIGMNIGQDSIIQANRIICNDNLIYLIDLYKFLQANQANTIINEIRNIILKYDLNLQNTQGYNNLRSAYNIKKSPLLLFVLIAFSFNHQIRFNNAHCFNNPFGKNRSSFNPIMQENLLQFIEVIQNKPIQFLNLDFKVALDSVRLTKQSFVYADPPYLITQGTYNDGKRGFSGWNEKLEKSLLESLRFLDTQGIKFALSNVLTHKGIHNEILDKWIKANGYIVHIIHTHYTNANYQAKHRDKSKTMEVLITNYQLLTTMEDKNALYR